MKKKKTTIEELEKRIKVLEDRPYHYHTIPFGDMPDIPNFVQPTYNKNLHYHNGKPCYNNPCIWC